MLEKKYGERYQALEDTHCDQAIEQALEGAPWLSPYLASGSACLQAFFRFAGVSESDVIVDIGCGDGRVLVAAAKALGCRGIGMDVSQECVDLASTVARAEGVDGLVSWHCVDATVPEVFDDLDLATATVVYLYTYPTLLIRLQGLVARLARGGARVFTLQYHMEHLEGWEVCASCDEPSMRLYCLQK
ncbi:unnamed protein product [Discosporangium mesarthrocarpum]